MTVVGQQQSSQLYLIGRSSLPGRRQWAKAGRPPGRRGTSLRTCARQAGIARTCAEEKEEEEEEEEDKEERNMGSGLGRGGRQRRQPEETHFPSVGHRGRQYYLCLNNEDSFTRERMQTTEDKQTRATRLPVIVFPSNGYCTLYPFSFCCALDPAAVRSRTFCGDSAKHNGVAPNKI